MFVSKSTTGKIMKGSSDKNIEKYDLYRVKNVRTNNKAYNVMIQTKKMNDFNCVEYIVISRYFSLYLVLFTF